MQHIIRKQTIALQLGKKADAFDMQHRMSNHFWKSIVPALEKLFDEACPDGETIYINKLELDLGILSEKHMHSLALPEEMLSGLAKQFYEKLSAGAAGAKATVQFQKLPLSLAQQWLYYMQKGYLPWNTLHVDTNWKKEAIEALVQDEASINILRSILRINSNIPNRIATQHTEALCLQLTHALSPEIASQLPLLLNELELLFKHLTQSSSNLKTLQNSEIKPEIWAHVLKLAATQPQKTNAKTLLRSIFERHKVHPLNLQASIQDLASQLTQLPPLVKEWLAERTAPNQNSTPPTQPILHPIDLPEVSEEKEVKTEILPNEPEPEESTVEEEGIFIQYAGLVLLHPFLSTFFNRLQLTERGNFINLAAQQKALYLLHYLATGEQTTEEYELIIPKVLCAYPIQKPVPYVIKLTPEETEEADALLAEVISQWVILKSTTPTGLQQEFLRRNGKLLTKNDKLHLLVETTAIDVLLDFLPWNLSLIKLPWMKELLRVEWR